jgi:thiol-disulfide isomerase/thioredoxin
MKHLILVITFCPLFFLAQPRAGVWRGVLKINAEEKMEIPFNFEVSSFNTIKQIVVHNAQEQILVDEITFTKDSLNFKMPVFDTEFKTKLIGDSILNGVWINHIRSENNKMTFEAHFGNYERFSFSTMDTVNSFYNGKWEVTFGSGSKDSCKAIGVFEQSKQSNSISGTFLTETGDYRFLEGTVHDNQLYLSSFDGSHAYLFIASHDGTQIKEGFFYSGNHWKETWKAKRNDQFTLANPEDLTHAISVNDEVDFTFSNSKKNKISLKDKQYKNKPMVIQIMGTWCPNCMDETDYLSSIYDVYNKKGLGFLAIDYERTTDFEKAKYNVQRLKKKFNVKYEILIAEFSGKEQASKSLPFLDKITAFPTTIILDKSHRVKFIYTGFSGPATGLEYEAFKKKFESVLTQLTK